MIANVMRDNFLRLYDKNFQFGSPGYDDTSVGQFLTDAQLVIFKSEYVPTNRSKGFESTEKIRRDLSDLIKDDTLVVGTITESSSQVGIHPNGVFYDLPDDFQWAIEEGVTLKITIGDIAIADEAEVLPVTHDFYKKNIRNSYKKPSINQIWRMDFSREDSGLDGGNAYTGRTAERIELIPDSLHTITDYRLRYLMTPPDIVVDTITAASQRHSILNSTLHYDIVLLAVKMATGATEPEEYPIANNEQKENIIN